MIRYIDLYFTTATILNWHPLLKDDKYKDVVIDSFRYAVTTKRATIWAFVIMDNHIHLIWQILDPNKLSSVRRDMLKYIAHSIKKDLLARNKTDILEKFLVNKTDRHYQIWKRKPLSISLLSDTVLNQKLNYIHTNLFRKGLDDITYKYSSAGFYATGMRNWDFL